MKYYRKSELSYSPLSVEDERKLFKAYYAGDIDARDRIVKNYLKLAVRLALRVSRGNIPEDEAISAANNGLMQAVSSKKYDPDRGLKFGSYAQQFIRGAVIRQFKKLSRLVGPQFEGQNLTLPHESEVELGEFGVTEDPVVDQVDFEQVRHDRVAQALDALPERTGKVVRMVYFEGKSFAEIGRIIGRSRERARQIHDAALAKLRIKLGGLDFLREEA